MSRRALLIIAGVILLVCATGWFAADAMDRNWRLHVAELTDSVTTDQALRDGHPQTRAAQVVGESRPYLPCGILAVCGWIAIVAGISIPSESRPKTV